MLANIQVVVNAAGPFSGTAPALMHACLRNRSHYLDLSNEACTFQLAWSLDSTARQAGVALVPGAGFGTVAAEDLAAHVLERINGTDSLTIVRTSRGGATSPGVTATTLELLARRGGGVRDGEWQELGRKTAVFELPGGRRAAVPVALGDAFAVAQATGVANVASYAATRMHPQLARWAIPAARAALTAIKPWGGMLRCRPTAEPGLAGGGTLLWMRAANLSGGTATSILEAGNGTEITAVIALQCLQKLLRHPPQGVFTAGQLLSRPGPLSIPGMQITDL